MHRIYCKDVWINPTTIYSVLQPAAIQQLWRYRSQHAAGCWELQFHHRRKAAACRIVVFVLLQIVSPHKNTSIIATLYIFLNSLVFSTRKVISKLAPEIQHQD